jgi:Type ISP C-terminal specificity domain/N-6 DNA Methylase
MLENYLKKIFDVTKHGDAREESYYSTLETLLNDYADSSGNKNVHVTTLPKKTEAGNPDFRIWDGKQHVIGYIEAKQPTVDNLNQIETSEQLKRYRHTFPNLILTNFFEFRLYRDGELVESVQVGRPFIAHKLKTVPPAEKETEFLALFEKFFSFSLPKVYDARNLAIELAKRTRFLRDEVVTQELKEEEAKGKENVLGFYKAFQQFLISGLTKEDFADLYSQTITYGLFAARTRSETGFSRKTAYDNIPNTIGILRDVFRFISLGDLPPQMEWMVDDISEVLSVADAKGILHKYFHEGKGKDPIIHFYETFLAEYDPQTRERRGVYYTPEPVVSYIVRSLHEILKSKFDKADGLASDSVTVLDPAAGTLTFLAEAAKLAVGEFVGKYGEGGKDKLIREHIVKNFYAFELMMAPYAIGHLKMSFLFEEFGFKLKKDERIKLYLTNTLEMEELSQTSLPGMSSLSEESHLAGNVKKDQPILVIMGNPPYSGHSSNFGDWISKEIKEYFQVDGKPLGERNPKWLQDDYVKFIRFAQWKIDQAGEGVIGLITNHSYLDNPTFRGMRQSLMNSFSEIYILDLHGNSLKKETCPDGSKDENVFDIRAGVAIALFIKKKDEKKKCVVNYAESFGLRENKYEWLLKHDNAKTKWKKIAPKSEMYFFVPRNEEVLAEYEKNLKITDIFPVNSVGIVTARDEFVIDFDESTLKRRIGQLKDKNLPDEIISQAYNLKDKSNWKLSDVRRKIAKEEFDKYFTDILYRPFDVRHLSYHDILIERARKDVMRHMLQENISLLLPKRVETQIPWAHIYCTNHIVDHVAVSLKTIDYSFPLYLYPDTDKHDLFSAHESKEKKPNINPKVFATLKTAFKKDLSPEGIFYYIYGILYAPSYRTKYVEFLKSDFPRIPFTANHKTFEKIADLGEQLVQLHLVKSKVLENPIAKFQGKGENKVEKLKYIENEESVYVNEAQRFEGVAKEVWNYQIGGYQVCEKWLKDRKGRTLSLDDLKLYCKIVTALQETIKIQNEIDILFPEVEKDLVAV